MPDVVGVAVDEDEGTDPLGMGDREMDRPRPGYVHCHQHRSLKARRIEDGGEVSVGDLSLDEGIPWVALRRTPASGVEPNGAAEGAQPLTKANEPRVLRQQIDRDATGHVDHQVDRSVAAHLVGDGGPVG
jgi:hypothetical protein